MCYRKTRLVLRHCQPTPWKHTDMRDQTLSHSTHCDTSVACRHHRFDGISYWGWICWGMGCAPAVFKGRAPVRGLGQNPLKQKTFLLPHFCISLQILDKQNTLKFVCSRKWQFLSIIKTHWHQKHVFVQSRTVFNPLCEHNLETLSSHWALRLLGRGNPLKERLDKSLLWSTTAPKTD